MATRKKARKTTITRRGREPTARRTPAGGRTAKAKTPGPPKATKPAGRRLATPATARRFVDAVAIPAPPARVGLRGGATRGETPEVALDVAKTQAAVVGSDVVSFVAGVTPERRQDIINSTLLAQLVAKRKVADATRVKEWYDAYFEVLTQIGWVIQDSTFAEYREASTDFAAHEAVMKVAAVLLGPGTAALAVVDTTLGALRSMSSESPWITLFDKESRTGKTAHFQVTLAEQQPNGKFLVSLMAFSLEAKATLTQVLFFRVRKNEATLRQCSGHVTIDTDVLDAVRPALKAKLAGWAQEYVRALPEL